VSGPLIDSSTWSDVLLEAGFSGNDIELKDFESNNCSQMSLILTTATEVSKPEGHTVKREIVMIAPELKTSQLDISQTNAHLEIKGYKVIRTTSLKQALASSNPDAAYLCMIELFQPYLRNMTADKFASLQRLLQAAKTVVWVTRGGGPNAHPDYAMIDGLSRVLRNENSQLSFVVLAFEIAIHLTKTQIEKLGAVLEKALYGTVSEDGENTFIESNGQLQIGRIIPADEFSQPTRSRSAKAMIKKMQYSDTGSTSLAMQDIGVLDSFYFRPQTTPETLLPMEVEIETRAVGLNFLNVLATTGIVTERSFAHECAGVVVRVGKGCQSFQPGDRVCGWGTEVFKSHVRLNYECVAKVPENSSFPEAACLPFCFITAYYILDLVRARRGESILIHSAAGGLGQATIQMSRMLGLFNIFVTVSSPEKKSLLIDTYGIPEDHIFFSRDTDFAQSIKRISPTAVDIVVNTLSGEGREASWDCVASYGRFVELSRADRSSSSSVRMRNSAANVSFFAVDIVSLMCERREILSVHFKKVIELFEERKLQYIKPLGVYSVETLGEALGHLRSGKSMGKVAVVLDKQAPVSVGYICIWKYKIPCANRIEGCYTTKRAFRSGRS